MIMDHVSALFLSRILKGFDPLVFLHICQTRFIVIVHLTLCEC